jgi:hypothetical protein
MFEKFIANTFVKRLERDMNKTIEYLYLNKKHYLKIMEYPKTLKKSTIKYRWTYVEVDPGELLTDYYNVIKKIEAELKD